MMQHLSAPSRPPQQDERARWFLHATWVECQRIAVTFGFSLTWEDDADGRTLLLLGADSPTEMTLHLRWAQLDGAQIEPTSALVLRWMIDRARHWTGRDIDWLALRDAALHDERT